MAELAQQTSAHIKQSQKGDESDLPTLPEIALRIRDETQFQNVSAASLSKVIAADPGLAALLLVDRTVPKIC